MESCFKIYKSCVLAKDKGELMIKPSKNDKEYHFQNWCEARIKEAGFHTDGIGRNKYPDFPLVEATDGYEIKGLAYPGREKDYDANSNCPNGYHNGRTIYYVFGRYPKIGDTSNNSNSLELPLIDMIICHGDFLNCSHEYLHKNGHVDGFGSYGDIMIRDRKMYVAPTPFALTEGTAGLCTLIIPDSFDIPEDFQQVGELNRVEAPMLLSGYSFDLKTNNLTAQYTPNKHANQIHKFKAVRLKSQSDRPVKMIK